MTTAWPSAASRRAVAAPIPRLAPVTTVTASLIARRSQGPTGGGGAGGLAPAQDADRVQIRALGAVVAEMPPDPPLDADALGGVQLLGAVQELPQLLLVEV